MTAVPSTAAAPLTFLTHNHWQRTAQHRPAGLAFCISTIRVPSRPGTIEHDYEVEAAPITSDGVGTGGKIVTSSGHATLADAIAYCERLVASRLSEKSL